MKYQSLPLTVDVSTIRQSYDGLKAILKKKGVDITFHIENSVKGTPNLLYGGKYYCRSLYCNKKRTSLCCHCCNERDMCNNVCKNEPRSCGISRVKR